MAFVAAAVAGGAALGAFGGAMSSGQDLNRTGINGMSGAYGAYQNLVGAGPGASAIANATQAQNNLAQTYQKDSENPMNMFNFSAGNQVAEQQFGYQRQQLAQSLQQQINQAQQAAAAAGRSVYDPVMQSRMNGQAMQMNDDLNAQQRSASIEYAQQIGQQQLQNQVSGVGVLSNMASQAYENQQNLFNMGSGLNQANLGAAQYDMSRGGGLKGMLTGLVGGAGMGMQAAGGMSQMNAANSMSQFYNNASMGGQQSQALHNFQFQGGGLPNMSGNNYMGRYS